MVRLTWRAVILATATIALLAPTRPRPHHRVPHGPRRWRPPRLAARVLRVLAAPLLLAVAFIGVAPAGASASTCVAWTGIQPPNPGMYNLLNGAAALSSCNAWAVGDYGASIALTHSLIEHWNGSAWTQSTSLIPGETSSVLSGAAVTSSRNAWAVGTYVNGTGQSLTLIEHWNGTAWKQVTSPNPGSAANILEGVAAVSSRNAWAVGYYEPSAGDRRTLIEHWNGTAWKQVRSPDPNGPDILMGVAATSSRNAWAVGDDNDSDGTLVLHWNGKAWKHLKSPNADHGSFLASVTATSSRNAWAVGQQGGNSALVLHWNGRTWRRAAIPRSIPPFASLSGVAATTFRSAWAVGSDFDAQSQTLVLHWNGRAWSRVASPGSPGSFSFLDGVAASSSGSIWAVGAYGAGGGQQTFAVHCC